MEPETDDALEAFRIRRLHDAYGDVVTRQAWAELVPLFEPACPIRFDLGGGMVLDRTGPEELGTFVADSVGRFSFFAFIPLSCTVEVDPDGRTATGRAYVQELFERWDRDEWSTLHGMYADTYLRGDDGRWRFATRAYSALARTVTTGAATTFGVPGVPGSDRSA